MSPSSFARSGGTGPVGWPLASDLAGLEEPLFGTKVRTAITRTRDWLLNHQQPDGHWVAELQGDTILESEYILLLAFLGKLDHPTAAKCGKYILAQQLEDGGWSIYPGGPLEISASVKSYFALKLLGESQDSPAMVRARAAILASGGADRVNSFTRFYLALLGQIPYSMCPEVPPEVIFLPRFAPVGLHRVSAWSRTMIVPLAIMSAIKPLAAVPESRGIQELFICPVEQWPVLRGSGRNGQNAASGWDRLFHFTDKLLKRLVRWKLTPLRGRAIAACGSWMLSRFERSDGLGAIFPPMVWSLIALAALGHDETSTARQYCWDRLQGLLIEEPDSARLQPCKSPVWDTAIALRAVDQSGLRSSHRATCQARLWLLDRQVLVPGDWSQTVEAAPGGWAFEYANDWYPDLDDTAMVAMALATPFDKSSGGAGKEKSDRSALSTPAEIGSHSARSEDWIRILERSTDAIQKAEAWILAMQNTDGGWGAFDRNNDCAFLCHVPFADHNAMIDPSTPDLTARVLEALGKLGRRQGDPAVDRAVDYLRRTQESDGSWYGRWGVNYVYGTWQALTGLAAVGVSSHDSAMTAGVHWLLGCQQSSGGWGETPASYDDPSLKGQGTPTPSQTAWAILGLCAAGLHSHVAVARGIKWLLASQKSDGSWNEPEFTGTGFPRVFYLKYHMYPIYFPLMALSAWANCRPGGGIP